MSERQVLERLLDYRRGKTTILITHRPRVIERADWIVMLDRGKLQIQGSPEQLRSVPGEHLDFLNDSRSSSNGNGKAIANLPFKAE